MKELVQKVSKLVAMLLLICALFLGVSAIPTSSLMASAEVKANDTDAQLTKIEIDSNTDTELVVSSDEGSYQYSAPKPKKFDLEPVEGEAALIDNEIVLYFNDLALEIPHFDFYKIFDAQDKFLYYQADVAKDIGENGSYAYIAAMPNQYGEYDLMVHYGIEEDWTLYMIKASLSKELLDFIDARSNKFYIGDDEISDRLRASSKVYMQGSIKHSDGEQPFDINRAKTSSLNAIKEYMYDSYTDTDQYLYLYSNKTALGPTENASGITDDPIVRIVPKELFFIEGKHIYIGREYGFFVNVIRDMAFGVSYNADVLVFDVYNQAPSFPNQPTGTCKITPKFNWRYQVREQPISDWYGYDPSLTQLVTISLDYNQAELFLDDIGVRVSLENPDALNCGDTGYVALQDDGAFIIQTRINAKGVGLKKKGGSFIEDTVGFAAGFVPYVSTALSVYSYVADVYYGLGQGSYLYYRTASLSDNEVNIETYETNNTDQIAKRNHLIKTKAVTIKSNADSPRLINVGGGYAEVKYVVARRSGSTYNNLRVITSVSANVLEDETSRWWLFVWIEEGEVVNYGRATGTYAKTYIRN